MLLLTRYQPSGKKWSIQVWNLVVPAAKALRTVKSCIGSTWCRYRQQDSVSMAVSLVGRYKGVKMAVSGCLRESAEAQGKVLSLTATSDGYNVYVCGNGGARPKACSSLATDIENLPQVPRPCIVAVAT